MATEKVAIFRKMKDLFHRLLDYYSITEEQFESLNKDVNPQSLVNEYRFNNVK